MSPRSFKPAVAAKVLAILGNGEPPFLTVATRRAGANEKVVERWVRSGLEEFADPDDEQTAFALEVRRVQAEWIAQQTDWLTKLPEESRNTIERARRVAWILECLDRSTFDLSRPPKEAPAGETNKPNARKSAADVAKSLADPELQ